MSSPLIERADNTFHPDAYHSLDLHPDRIHPIQSASIKIAFGTDVDTGSHSTNAQEFIYMHQAGMPPVDCFISATDLIGASDTIGTIEIGKATDIIAVPENPLEDISVMLNVNFVMARGEVVKE